MALNENASFLVSSVLSILTFSTMQMLKPLLASSQPLTIVGGALGGLLFTFLLTTVGNLEKIVFGHGFATKWAEVVVCLLASVFAAASVHRVSATVALLTSALMLHSMNALSNRVYGGGTAAGQNSASATNAGSKKRK